MSNIVGSKNPYVSDKKSRGRSTTFDRGRTVGDGTSRMPAGVEFHRTAQDRKPPREVVTAKLLGDPPADLEYRRANPGPAGRKPRSHL